MTTISRPFLDKLLLSLIEAHISADMKDLLRQRERENRLHAAKKALFGDTKRDKHFGDSSALLHMAEEYIRDRWIDARNLELIRKEKPRSIRTLAKEASQLTYGNSFASVVQRLRSEFRGKTKKKYLGIARYSDDVDDFVEYQVLENVRKLLHPYGVDMDLAVIGPGPNIRPKKSAKLASKQRR
jgi:hypothetical protein